MVDRHIPRFDNIDDSLPWWLWCNLWGIDAVAVAVVWQRFLGSRFQVEVPLYASLALGSIVAGIYLADRWLDTRTAHPDDWRDRHRYAARHPRLFAGLSMTGIGLSLIAASQLPFAFLKTGGILALIVAIYFAIVHQLRFHRLSGFKEITVGCLFATGVSIPLMTEVIETDLVWIPTCAAFALLCAGNCLLITDWESSHSATRQSTICYFGASAILTLSLFAPWRVSGTLLASTMGLILLNRFETQLHPRAIRVLADVVLLTPIIPGLAW